MGQALSVGRKARRRERALRRGMPRLMTERDLAALAWISEQYTVSLDQLQRVLAVQAGKQTRQAGLLSASRVRKIVARWQQAGWVQVQKVLMTYEEFVWLTPRGLHQIQSPHRAFHPKAGQLAHYYACTQVRLCYEGAGEQGEWRSERRLRAQAWQRAGAGRKPHLPDAEWVLREGGTQAIEVELSAKVPERLRSILRSLGERYESVVYVVGSPVLGRRIEAGIAALDPEVRARFTVVPLSLLGGRS